MRVPAPLPAILLAAACRASSDPSPDDTADTDAAAISLPGLELGAAQRCPDASLRDSLGPYLTTHLPMDPHTWVGFHGLGVGVADLDGDGALEIVLPGPVRTRMIRWEAAGPVDITSRLGGLDLADATGAIPVDLEGDGDLDLFIARDGRHNVVLINDGAGHFTDGSARSGLVGGPTDASMGAAFADIDHDGDLDAFVPNYGEIDLTGPEPALWAEPPGNHLYENTGDGLFVDRSDLLPAAARAGLSFTGGFLDLDDDGLWELYVTHDFGDKRVPNVLVAVDGFEVAPLPSTGLELGLESMGLTVGDLDGDGDDEVMLPGWGRLAVMSNHGGLWFDDTQAYGLGGIGSATQKVGWATAITDLDNDGASEAFLSFGFVEVRDRWRNQPDQRDLLWRRDGNGDWSDQAASWRLDDPRSSRGLAVVDLDGNGVLDLVRPTLDDGDTISLGRCSDHAWISLSLSARGANPFGVGARVRVTAGEATWSATVRAGGGSIGSGEPPVVHLGLGGHDTVDTLEVRWPDGATSTWTDVPTRRAMRAVQPGR